MTEHMATILRIRSVLKRERTRLRLEAAQTEMVLSVLGAVPDPVASVCRVLVGSLRDGADEVKADLAAIDRMLEATEL